MADMLSQLTEQKRKVDFDTFDITVKELVGMVADEMIDIAPDYQRKFRWGPERQATLIESVFLGIPIPPLFMAANLDGTWELIDGVQRLNTLVHYIGGDALRKKLGLGDALRLKGLSKLPVFNDITFEELPSPVQLQFRLRPMKVTTISDKSDVRVRFDLFERLNTGGVLLSPQEIRACLHQGSFNDFLKEMAKDAAFRAVVKLNENQEKDGTPEEFALRFFAYLHKYQEFEHGVKPFLNDFMTDASKEFDYTSNRKLFRRVFKVLSGSLPDGIARGKSVTPVNLFEAITVGAALALQQSRAIEVNGLKDWMVSKELSQYTTAGTNSKTAVEKRIHFCRDRFLGA